MIAYCTKARGYFDDVLSEVALKSANTQLFKNYLTLLYIAKLKCVLIRTQWYDQKSACMNKRFISVA